MATVTEKQIADQAEYVETLEARIKEQTKELREEVKDAKKELSRLIRERKSGQMTFDRETGEVGVSVSSGDRTVVLTPGVRCPHDRVNMAGKCLGGEQMT
jgi:uncharacterized protein YdhG (YjbR/CyaY superfamily)